MKRSRRGSRRSLSSNQWTLLLLFLIILALAALIAFSWMNRPSAPPQALVDETSSPTATPEPTSTPRPTAIPPTRAAPTSPASPTPAIFYPAFIASDCRFTVPRGASITCGVVPVPENRNIYPGRTVRLAVAIFHSASSSPAEDPVLYLHDSPINSAIQWAAINYDNFVLPITESRDLIVFDLRGDGLSVPNLDCPEVKTVQRLDERGSLVGEQKFTAFADALSTCRERLASYGIDVSKYTTKASAADAHDVIRALGLGNVNLFSASYGTRLAQMVLRDYPQEIRSAVLDSPSPLGVNLYKEAAAHYDLAINTLFAHCLADPVCNTNFRELSNVFDGLVTELDSQPLQITIPADPGTPDHEIWLDGLTLTRAVLSSLNSSYYISSIPKILTDFNTREMESSLDFIQNALALPGQPLLDLSSGMRLSADCHEQVYATTSQEIEQAQEAFPRTRALGMEAIFGDGDLFFNLCDIWGAAPYEPSDEQPVQSDIPVLILSGQFDTLYPASLARQLAQDLSGGLLLEVPGSGHEPVFNRRSNCPINLVNSFLDIPTQLPDQGCLESLAVSYYTAYTGEPPLELLPFVNEEEELQTTVPTGWIDNGQGIYGREAYFGDFTELYIQVSDRSASEWLNSLTDDFKGVGFDRTPARNTTRFANQLNWTLYRAFSENQPVDLAFAEADEKTLMVLLLSQSAERDALYRSVFLPTIENTFLR
jgi:pimeloyl-ACP methyl ester carboxylesterase